VKGRQHMQLSRRRKRNREVPVEAREERVCGPNASEPACSPVTQVGEAEPLQIGRRQHQP